MAKKKFQIRLVNYSVPQNTAGDAAYQKSLQVAQQILPNGPIAIKMAKAAINKGMQVTEKIHEFVKNVHLRQIKSFR